MKTIILAGGKGTRLSEETHSKPKPMVEIGPAPILWHIITHYSMHGFEQFYVATGYRSDVIEDWCDTRPEWLPWKATAVHTGHRAQTGGRVKRLGPLMQRATFMVTYGDGLSDINITNLVAFHKSHGKLATVTAVQLPARFGRLDLDGEHVCHFSEKAKSEGWINGGFFVFEPGVLDYIEGDDTALEKEPLTNLAKDGQLMAFKHEGFWHPMDTVRDRDYLEELWRSGKAPWAHG